MFGSSGRTSLIARLPLVACLSIAVTSCVSAHGGPARDVTEAAAPIVAAAPATYRPADADVPAAAANAQVRATFEHALAPAAKGLAHDPALDTVAAVVAAMVSRDRQTPSQALIQWLFWRAGAVVQPSRVVIMTTAGTDDLDFQTADYAGKVQASVYPESFGLARATSGRPAQVIVFASRPLTVDPIPKSYAPGATITLRVTPTDAFTELRLLSDDDAGGVATDAMTYAADGSYSVTRKAPTKPGRYFLEVTGLDPRALQAVPENPWRRSLFWVPIYIGVPEPVAPDDALRGPHAADATDAASWAARILDGYNAARSRGGKPPIATDGRLASQATERSVVFARSGREPPPDAVLADKLAAAGFPPRDYDEHHARVDTVADYVYLRLLQPSVKRRLLADVAPVIGLGLTPNAPNGLSVKDQADYTLVEEIVEPAARLDPAKDPARVIAALDAQGAAEGRPPLKHDPDVAKVVQGFADEVCAGAKSANKMKPLVDKARGVGEKYHTWGNPIWRAGYDFGRWQETSLLARSKEPAQVYAEVGLCQGNLPGKPGGSYVVVLPYGP
jgi:hypothetical protein